MMKVIKIALDFEEGTGVTDSEEVNDAILKRSGILFALNDGVHFGD